MSNPTPTPNVTNLNVNLNLDLSLNLNLNLILILITYDIAHCRGDFGNLLVQTGEQIWMHSVHALVKLLLQEIWGRS